ncbi:MAG: hypothetical protein J0G97_02240, partial [Rhizobium pusense]|nr:hypothetical protein [Agrobacterium pusense]
AGAAQISVAPRTAVRIAFLSKFIISISSSKKNGVSFRLVDLGLQLSHGLARKTFRGRFKAKKILREPFARGLALPSHRFFLFPPLLPPLLAVSQHLAAHLL